MGGKGYVDSHGKFVLDVMRNARRLPEDENRLYLDGIMAVLKALSEGRDAQVHQAMQILKSEG